MTEPTTAEICARFRGMYVPAVSDAMYELGMPEPVLPTALRPLFPEQSFVGIAFTVEGVEIVPAVAWDEGKQRIASYLEVFEKLTPDSVMVSKNTGNLVGHFGELTGNSAMKHGCVGVVLDGNLRDTAGLREIGLQVFYRDVNPRSGMGRWEMVAYQQPVTIGDVTVHPGDSGHRRLRRRADRAEGRHHRRAGTGRGDRRHRAQCARRHAAWHEPARRAGQAWPHLNRRVPVQIAHSGLAEEVVVLEWLAADGQQVEAGSPLVVIESEKTELEIEAPASGRLEILVPASDIEVAGRYDDRPDPSMIAFPDHAGRLGRAGVMVSL